MENQFEELKSELGLLKVMESASESVSLMIDLCKQYISDRGPMDAIILVGSSSAIERACMLAIKESFDTFKYDVAKDYFNLLIIASKALNIVSAECGINLKKDGNSMPGKSNE